MENNNNLPSSSESRASKKRKLLVDADGNGHDSEIWKLKELIEKQQKTIYNQAMTIKELKEEKENCINDRMKPDSKLHHLNGNDATKENEINKLKSKCNIFETKIKNLEAQLQLKTNNEIVLQNKIDDIVEVQIPENSKITPKIQKRFRGKFCKATNETGTQTDVKDTEFTTQDATGRKRYSNGRFCK